jgi:hypothetical protein
MSSFIVVCLIQLTSQTRVRDVQQDIQTAELIVVVAV